MVNVCFMNKSTLYFIGSCTIIYVKMVYSCGFIPTVRQSAWYMCNWFHCSNIYHQRLNIGLNTLNYSTNNNIRNFFYLTGKKNLLASDLQDEVDIPFIEWLVGFTDGDGTFSISKNKNKNHYTFTFKLTQSVYNGRILYYIKSKLGYGSVTKDGPNLLQYRIRDKEVLKNRIIPIFDSYPLHSSKYYSYSLFKEALFSEDYKHIDRLKPLFKTMPLDYTSPHTNIPSKNWIIGFIEAEGSFFIVDKDKGRYVHCFGVTQKLDTHLLHHLRDIFGISASVKLKKNAWLMETTNSRSIEYIIKYFDGTFKGMKSVEFRIWSRTYFKHKGNNDKLHKVQLLLRKIRNRHKKENPPKKFFFPGG